MGLGWDSALKLGAVGAGITDAIFIIIYFLIRRGNDPFWLSVILILSVLLVVVVLVPWIASKRVEKELLS